MKPLLLFFTLACCVGCGQAVFKKRWLDQQAPAQFVAYVETSKGRFEVQVTRAWSPLAADRFYQMLTHHFEVVIRQMMRKVQIQDPGDTLFLEDQLVHASDFIEENDKLYGMKVIEDAGDSSNLKPGQIVTPRELRDEKTTVNEEKYRHNIFEYAVGIEEENETGTHPAIFPELLAQDHILSWSNEGDTVLDPFMGSGTTAKMALLNNRNYIGFELSEEYCKIAEERIS